MKTAQLGSLTVSRIGLGAMTVAGTYTTEGGLDDDESVRTVHRAPDLGVTHLDTAEIHGPFHRGEIVGRPTRGRRDDVVIATEVGPVAHDGRDPATIDSSAANVRTEENTAADAVEPTDAQLARLDGLTPAAGARHDETDMATVDR